MSILSGNDYEAAKAKVFAELAAEKNRREWLSTRCGKITASNFGKISFDGKQRNGLTKVAETYLNSIVAEYLTGSPAEEITSRSTEHGKLWEPTAIAVYESEKNVKVTAPGVLLLESGSLIGGTPDGLTSDGGIIEVKCPYNSGVHVENIIRNRVPDEYRDQVNGYLLITGRQRCDFISFDPRVQDPRFRMHIITVERNDGQLAELRERILKFESILRRSLQALGLDPNPELPF